MNDTFRLNDTPAPETFDTSWARENPMNVPVLTRADMAQHQQIVNAYAELLNTADAPHEELAKAQLADKLAPLLKMPKQWVLSNVAEIGAQMTGAPKTPHGLLEEVGQSLDLGVKQVDLANRAALLMAQAKTGTIDPVAWNDAKKIYDETNLMGGAAMPLSKLYARLKGQALSDPLVSSNSYLS